jgi:hypothetical protein
MLGDEDCRCECVERIYGKVGVRVEVTVKEERGYSVRLSDEGRKKREIEEGER